MHNQTLFRAKNKDGSEAMVQHWDQGKQSDGSFLSLIQLNGMGKKIEHRFTPDAKSQDVLADRFASLSEHILKAHGVDLKSAVICK